MRKTLTLLILMLGVLSTTTVGQQLYSHDKVEYTFELPSPTWKSILEPDAGNDHPEFVFGDRLDGYLTIRKEIVDAGTTATDVSKRDHDLRLRYLPGFVEGKIEPFNGRLDGVSMGYEFVRAGKPMVGRNYYLVADSRTIYVIRFTGLRDKLTRIRNQTDLIARTFQLKKTGTQ
jgi:hypothetical protein